MFRSFIDNHQEDHTSINKHKTGSKINFIWSTTNFIDWYMVSLMIT